MRIKKISLSPELEKRFFEEKLSKREILELKEISEAYQKFKNPEWSSLRYRPYSQYFGFINALKTRKVLEELWQYSYLNSSLGSIDFLDFGAGTLGATLGAVDFFKEKKIKIEKLYSLDQDQSVMKWSMQYFKDFLPASIEFLSHLKDQAPRITVMANVWNEILFRSSDDEFHSNPIWQQLEQQMKTASEESLWIFIEPSSREINHKFLKLRDYLSQNLNILLPCTHQQACPALAANEWCHEERAFKAPNQFWELVRSLGYRQKNLLYSFLVVGKSTSQFRPSDARILSKDLGGKGRCEKWLCADGKRWKESRLSRFKNEQNASFYEGLKGDIIESASTFSDTKS